MKYYLSIVIVLSLSLYSSLAQNNTRGFTQYFYPNNQVSSEGIMKDGKPDGYWKTYNTVGILQSEGLRRNFLLDSTWSFYNNQGELKQKINFRIGKKNGYTYSYSYEYNAEPVIISKELYLNDKKEGKSFYYFIDGKIKVEINYKEGKKEGAGREYNSKGELITLMEYHNNYIISREKVNRTDSEGKKQGLWKLFFENGKLYREMYYTDNELDGQFKEYNDKGSIILMLNYIKGVLVAEEEEILAQEELDIRRKFDNNGELSFQGSYKKDIPVGVHRYYDEEGNVVNSKIYNNFGVIIAEGILDDEGRKKGVWKEFYLSGELRAKGNYQNNQKSGLWSYYYKNGGKEQSGNYMRGLADGLWTWYYISGNLLREEGYFNGREDGEMIEYSEKGEIISKGNFINGEKEGSWSYFSGDHIEKGDYITGLRDGEWQYYYADGKIHFEGNFFQGFANGKHKFYYPNGSIKEERFYEMGIKEKNWKKYDKEGNLTMTISFKRDIEYRINGEKINLPSGSIKVIK